MQLASIIMWQILFDLCFISYSGFKHTTTYGRQRGRAFICVYTLAWGLPNFKGCPSRHQLPLLLGLGAGTRNALGAQPQLLGCQKTISWTVVIPSRLGRLENQFYWTRKRKRGYDLKWKKRFDSTESSARVFCSKEKLIESEGILKKSNNYRNTKICR